MNENDPPPSTTEGTARSPERPPLTADPERKGFAGELPSFSHETQKALQDALDRMTDGFAVLDREGRVSYFNRVAGELLLKREGTRDGVMGISFWELIPEFKGTGVEEEFQRALAEQTPVQFEIFYPRTESWYEVRGYPSEEGLSLYFRDVTEARRLREGWVWG